MTLTLKSRIHDLSQQWLSTSLSPAVWISGMPLKLLLQCMCQHHTLPIPWLKTSSRPSTFNLPRVLQPLPKIYILEYIFLTHQSTLVWTAFLLSITALIRIRPDLFTCRVIYLISVFVTPVDIVSAEWWGKKKYLTIAYHWTMFLKICFHFFSP